MVYNLAKRVLKKAGKIIKVSPNGGVVIKPAKWTKEQAQEYLEKMERNIGVNIETNAENRVSYPNLSRAVECVINKLQNEKRTFRNILVLKNPYQYSPLCALALFETKRPYRVKVTVRGKTEDCDVSYTIKSACRHRIPIMGLYPGMENTIDLELLDKKEKRVRKKTFKLTIAPLKGKSAEIKITKESSKAEYIYGLTLVYGGDDGIFPYAFDKNGDIRFAFAMSPKTYGFQPISNGRFLFLNKSVTRLTCTNTAATQLFEVDQMGRFHKIYNVEKGAHHDFAELKNRNFIAGGNCIEGNTFEDTVIEIDRKTGAILNEIRIKDYIDKSYVDSPDWAHLNTVQYDEDEKTVIVCLRNLHSVIKINYEKKELMWILGHPEYWKDSNVSEKVLKPEGEDMQWFFQPHAAYFLTENLSGNPDAKYLMLYDNHTQKRIPVSFFDNDNEKSHVRIYEINEKLHTVHLFKTFSFEKSNIRSNALLEKDAGRVLAMNGKLLKKDAQRKASIVEFDYNSGEVINQWAMNFGFYRAYKFDFAVEKISEPMETDGNYSLGKVYQLEKDSMPDIDSAKNIPEPVLEAEYTNEEDRKNKLSELCKKNPNYPVDAEQDMARIKMVLEEDVLYIYLLDHQLEKIYFVGKNNVYSRDYTATKQERPEYFARAGNIDANPLGKLEADSYEIYFKHKIGLYKSKYYIKISRGE